MFLDCERRNFVIQVLNSFLLVRKTSMHAAKKHPNYNQVLTEHGLIQSTGTYL